MSSSHEVFVFLQKLGSDLEAAVRSAVASGPVKEALSQLLAAAQTLGGDSRQHASAGAMVVSAGKKAAKAEKEPQAAEQPSKPKKKRERAEAAEDAAALNSPAAPAKKKKKRLAGTKGDTQPAAADKEPPAKPILPAAGKLMRFHPKSNHATLNADHYVAYLNPSRPSVPLLRVQCLALLQIRCTVSPLQTLLVEMMTALMSATARRSQALLARAPAAALAARS